MAEVSSTLDDLIIKNMQESIDAQVGLVPEGRKQNEQPPEVNLLSSLDQIDNLHVEQGQELVQKGETQVKSLSNSSQFEVINEGKEKEVVGSSNRNEKKEGKKEKRPRRRGKESKKHSIHDFERQTVCDCDKRGDRARVVYIKEEMEALRYVGIDEQKKKWIEVYCGLEPVVAEEYDVLVGSGHQNEQENSVNFDPRPLTANKKGNEVQNMNQVDHGVKSGDLDGEEDYYEEEEDSDSEYVSIQRPAFMVTGEPDFDSGPPQDGLEYLRRVRWETEHIPKVKVAKVERSVLNKEQTVYMPKIPDIAACPELLMPSIEWEDAFLADFSKLRLALSQDENSEPIFSGESKSIPLAQTVSDIAIQENLDFCQTDNAIQENLDFSQIDEGNQENLDFCQTDDGVQENLDISQTDNGVQENLDFFQTDGGTQENLDSSQTDAGIQENLDFSQTDDVIQRNLDFSQTEEKTVVCDWPSLQNILEMEPVARVTMLRKRIRSMETVSSLCRNDCAWLFALCAAIDVPLDADTSASLRCLLRKCAALRAEKVDLDDEVIMLNILVTISGKYFGQLETI